jgi:hypothetical protein
MDLIQKLAGELPHLTDLSVSSLYLDQPARGLPFHFHLPPQLGGLRHPEADLQLLAGLPNLTSLHLNTAYPAKQLGQCLWKFVFFCFLIFGFYSSPLHNIPAG